MGQSNSGIDIHTGIIKNNAQRYVSELNDRLIKKPRILNKLTASFDPCEYTEGWHHRNTD